MQNTYFDDEIKKVIPQKLKSFRVENGYTLQKIGDRFGVTKAAVSSWEKGKAQPSTKVLFELCNLYKIDFSDLTNNQPQIDFKGLSGKEQKIIAMYRNVNRNIQKSIETILKECSKEK